MKKTLFLTFAALLAVSFTGCSVSSHSGKGRINVLGGLATVEQGAFAPKHPVSFTVRQSDLSFDRDVSGTQTSLLWGLFNYSDY